MNASCRVPRHAWLLFLVPLIASAATRDWWAPDEPRYAEVAREIYTSGEALVMHLCGAIYKNKPPLLFWISGFFGSITNWNELAMRIPSLVATLISAWLTARLARRFWGEDEARLAPILYLTTAMVLWHGARMQIDPLLGALCLGALVIASEPTKDAKQRARAFVCAGLLTGLGVLAKGPIALMLVGVPLATWRWILGPNATRVSNATHALADFAALAPGLCWALAVVARKPELAYDLFVRQFFERAVNGANHINPWWYHGEIQPLMMLPWTIPFFAGSWLAWCALRDRLQRKEFDAGVLQSGLWFWALFIAFSLSPEKRDLYLLPAFPAVALLGARWIMEAVRNRRESRALSSIVPALLLITGVLLCSARAFETQLPEDFRAITWQPFAVALPLVLGAALSMIKTWRGELVRATVALASGLALTATLAALIIFPMVNPSKSARALAFHLAQRPEHPREIPCIGVMPEGYRFYSGRPVVHGPLIDRSLAQPELMQQDAFVELARGEGAEFLALVDRDDWERWSEATRAHFEVRHDGIVGGGHVLLLGKAR